MTPSCLHFTRIYRHHRPFTLSTSLLLLALVSLTFAFTSFTFPLPLASPPFVVAGRVPTAIKINTVQDRHVPPVTGTTGGHAGHYQRRTAPLALFRPPNPPIPPPFIRGGAEETTPDGGSDLTDVGGTLATDDTILASYYGDGEGDSNSEAAGTNPSIQSSTTSSITDSPTATTTTTTGDAPTSTASSDEKTLTNTPVTPSAAGLAWTQLNGSCWTHTTSAYIYSFCPFQNMTQRSTTTILHVVLGVFDTWIEIPKTDESIVFTSDGAPIASTHEADSTPSSTREDSVTSSSSSSPAPSPLPDSLFMHFTDGTLCGNGKRRSTSVEFICSLDMSDGAHIGEVTEPSTCQYAVTFHTPLMCDPTSVRQARMKHNASLAQAEETIANMQTCIHLLFTSLQTYEPDEIARVRPNIDTVCGSYIANANRASSSSSSVSSSEWANDIEYTDSGDISPPTSAESTGDLSDALSSASSISGSSSSLSSSRSGEVTDLRPSSIESPIRANIPQTIIESHDSTHTVDTTHPLHTNEDGIEIATIAAKSPYAQLDDETHEEL